MELATRLFLIRPLPASEDPRQAAGGSLDELELLLSRLAARRPALVVGGALEPGLAEIAQRIGAPLRTEARLDPRDGGAAPDPATRALTVLGELASGHPRAEVVVVLHADGIRAALACALQAADARVFEPEPGQAIALDWAHPQAREFQHALIGIAFDWDVGPVAQRAHRFPGGASVSHRPS